MRTSYGNFRLTLHSFVYSFLFRFFSIPTKNASFQMSVFRLPLEVDALLFLSFLFIGFYMCDCFKVRFLFDFIAYRRYCSVSFISAWCICFVTSVFFICFVIIDILLHLSVVHSMYFINGLFFFIYCIYSFILLYSVHALKNQNSVV